MKEQDKKPSRGPKITVSRNGPYLVTGGIPLSKVVIATDAKGGSESWEQGQEYPAQESYALCRCGQSKNKPFCDSSHKKTGFDGTETASRAPYMEQAEAMEGPALALTDAQGLCAFARYCDPHGQVWNQVKHTGDPKVRERFLRQVGNCPSGRLVAWDKKTQKPLEPELPVSIALIEDPSQGCSGPIWVRGRVPVVSADGFEYEIRNRVTLCRCGQSQNKPFCDGTHAAVKFRDE